MKHLFLAMLVFCAVSAIGQDLTWKSLQLDDFSSFKPPTANWKIAADVAMYSWLEKDSNMVQESYVAPARKRRKKRAQPLDTVLVNARKDSISYVPGKGVLFNDTTLGNKHENIYSNWEHGDLDLELEVMLPRGSNSGLYFMGSYELQLFDSWNVPHPKYGDMGGIYRNWEKGNDKEYEGKPPLTNASKAPGLWQKLRISFKAPVFDSANRKIRNARFNYVYLNDVLIQDNIEIPQMTGGSMFSEEQRKGPLFIQGDHGPVALRNIRYRMPVPVTESGFSAKDYVSGDDFYNPVYVDQPNETRLFRSFYDFVKADTSIRLTRTMSVGDPGGMHYLYNLASGNLAVVWRGGFIDATRMWSGRGDGSFVPIGVTQLLSAGPCLAELKDSMDAFPMFIDSAYKSEGYSVHDRPVFKYRYKGSVIQDRIWPDVATGAMVRAITFDSLASKSLYVKIAEGKEIHALGHSMYVVGDKEWYLKLDGSDAAFIRKNSGGAQELLVKVVGNPIQYSIIW